MDIKEFRSVPAAAPVLVIGATCVDVVIGVDRLPVKGGHCMALSHKMSPGGCAYNVAAMLRLTGTPVQFVTPVGTGLYGEFVEKNLTEQGFPVRIHIPEENGCCYCLVEPDGERSFIPFHGGEYAFRKEWMQDVDVSGFGYVYVGGIELNEPSGDDLVSWIEETEHTPEVFFAPSPHIGEIKPGLVTRLMELHPILHMNADESFTMSGRKDVFEAAAFLRERTKNAVIITLGARGALCLEKKGLPYIVPARERKAVDTTGAGDAHAGALLSALSKGLPLREAADFANEMAALVISVMGASLPEGYI